MIERVTLSEWLAFDAQHPAPTFFARPAWALSLAEIYPNLTPVLLRISAGRNAKPLLLPIMEERGFAFRRFTGFPLGGYTCFLHEDGSIASEAALRDAIGELERFAHSIDFVPWPLGPQPPDASGAMHETAVVDLRDGIEAALKHVDGNFRRMAGQAERRGVTCAPSTQASAVDDYYQLLRESATRWGIPEPVERRMLIDALVRYGGKDVEIWFARAQERAIAGGVVFYGSSEFFFWSAAMDAQYGRLRPSNALNFALLHAAAARGMQWYNLGSSEGLPGVARFKKDLGARELAYREFHFDRMSLRLLRGMRNALAGARAHA